ncbi:MAG: alpha/beta fold hydrolase [Thermonemataceae bacterium]
MPDSYPYHLQSFKKEEVEVVYTDLGEGEQTLVFIHGLASYLPIWVKNIDYFKQYYRCIAIDLPGHGYSSKGDYPYTMTFYVEMVSALLKKLAVKKAILIGHSMGGQIAIFLATQAPMQFSHLVLAAPAGFETFNGTQRAILSQLASPQTLQYVQSLLNLKNYFHDLKEKDYSLLEELNGLLYQQTDASMGTILSKSMKGMLNEPVFDRLEKIIQPTLVLFGESDQLIPNRFFNNVSTQRIALQGTSQIRNHKLRMMANCGHFLQYECAETFNKEVSTFLHNHVFVKV